MRKKLKPELDLDAIQEDTIEEVVQSYHKTGSLKATGRELGLSLMKVRKILITAREYETEVSREINIMFRNGYSIDEIAEQLHMSASNVYGYLPYYNVIYNMGEKSVAADKQARYRKRLKEREEKAAEVNAAEITTEAMPSPAPAPIRKRRRGSEEMIIVMNEKIRKYLPKDFCSKDRDPLDREFVSLSSGASGYDPYGDGPEPGRNVWIADITSNGRGKKRQAAAVLESASSGFAVVTRIPEIPEELKVAIREDDFKDEDGYTDWSTYEKAKNERKELLYDYRNIVAEAFLKAIYDGLTEFLFPQDRIVEYMEEYTKMDFGEFTVSDSAGEEDAYGARPYTWLEGVRHAESTNDKGIKFVKSRHSIAAARCEELCKRFDKISARDEYSKNGKNIADIYNANANNDSRKFGFSYSYRPVLAASAKMLRLEREELDQCMKHRLEVLYHVLG